MKVYLDNSATTKVDKEVLESMRPYHSLDFGNPSSIHSFGQKTRKAIDESRRKVAEILNCSPDEVVFTSGGSESDNLAIRGIIEAVLAEKEADYKPHIITSKIEHHAILHTVEELEKREVIEATYLGVDKFGMVDVKNVEKAIKENTALVSIMYVNNEVGTIEPIREIGKIIEKVNKKRKENQVYFHTDAVQAAGNQNLDVLYLHVDLLTLTAHKIHGPKGTGILYVKKGTPLVPQITGGSHEYKMRAGTENVAGIVGFAKALELAISSQEPAVSSIRKLCDYLEGKLKKEIKNVQINGHPQERAPHILNVSFKGVEGESILLSLDMEGIAASSGSACTSGSLEPSHVLTAMDVEPAVAQGSIRFSLSRNNKKTEIDYTVEKLKKIIKRLRKISPIK